MSIKSFVMKIGGEDYDIKELLNATNLIKGSSTYYTKTVHDVMQLEGVIYNRLFDYFCYSFGMLEDQPNEFLKFIDDLVVFSEDKEVFRFDLGKVIINALKEHSGEDGDLFALALHSYHIPGDVHFINVDDLSDFEGDSLTVIEKGCGYNLVKIASNEDFLMTKMAFSDYFKDHIIAKDLNLYSSFIDLIMAKLEDHGNDVDNFRNYLKQQYLTF